jgi:rod shape-determining protein MreC
MIAGASVLTLHRAALRTARDFFYPYLSIPGRAKNALSDSTLLLKSKTELAGEIERLRKENQILATRVASAADLKLENEDLRNLLKMQHLNDWKYIFAKPLLKDPLAWQERFIIDKGSDAGIEKGAIVLSSIIRENKIEPVVLGRVKSLSRHSAEITTILSPETNLTVFLSDPGAVGFTEGRKHGTSPFARITYLPKNRSYTPGSTVYTSGFNPAIPPMLLVGTLESIDDSTPNRLYVSGLVKPAADISSVNSVIIMVREK